MGEIEMIHEALECANDQLRMIVDWPLCALQSDTTVRQNVLRQLRTMPELGRLDKARCSQSLFCSLDDMRGFIEMTDEERVDYCTVLLRDFP